MKISKFYPWVLLGGGGIGLVSAIWQGAERIQQLKAPGHALSCNLNPVLACGQVLDSKWASVFGFPNCFIAIAIFAMLILAGVVLVSGMKPSKLFSRVLLGLSTILILFALWFFGMSLYVIGKVCIFCLFIWAVSVPIFWYSKLYYFQNNPPRRAWAKRWLAFFEKHHLDVLALVYVVLIVLYFWRFRSYYFG